MGDQLSKYVEGAVAKLAADQTQRIEDMLAALPAGMRLCVHDGIRLRTEDFNFDHGDTVKFTASQRGHVLGPDEQCDLQGTRTEYGPRSDKAERLNQKTLDQLRAMSPDRCCQAGRVNYPDACPWHGEQSAPTITANVLKAHLPVAEGPCPDCGKPAAYAETPHVRVHHDEQFQLDQAAEDACPAVIEARAAAAATAASFDKIIFDALDSHVDDAAAMMGMPGIFSTAQAQWAAGDDEPPEALYDRLHEMFKRIGTPPPRPPVSPDTVRRSQEAAGMPRAPWIAIKASLDEPDATAFWMQPEPAADAYAVNAGIAPALWGVPLYRTGTYLARPVAEGGGWDVAEVMVTR